MRTGLKTISVFYLFRGMQSLNDNFGRDLVPVNMSAMLEPSGIERSDSYRPDAITLLP